MAGLFLGESVLGPPYPHPNHRILPDLMRHLLLDLMRARFAGPEALMARPIPAVGSLGNVDSLGRLLD